MSATIPDTFLTSCIRMSLRQEVFDHIQCIPGRSVRIFRVSPFFSDDALTIDDEPCRPAGPTVPGVLLKCQAVCGTDGRCGISQHRKGDLITAARQIVYPKSFVGNDRDPLRAQTFELINPIAQLRDFLASHSAD